MQKSTHIIHLINVQNWLYHTKENMKPPSCPLPVITCPAMGNHDSDFYSTDEFCCFCISYKWKHTLCSFFLSGFFCSALCLWNSAVFLHVAIGSFSLLGSVPWWDSTTIYPSVLLLMGIWMVSSFYSYEHSRSELPKTCPLLGLYLDKEVLGHGVYMCSALVDTVRKFCPVDV